mgnify:CR=1 FL=1
MKQFLRISRDKDKKYMLNQSKIKQIIKILKLLIMPKGLKAGQTLYECTTNYQWLFYIGVLAVVYRDNPEKRRYETGLLEICRKNFKTFTIAVIFIILFLTEPDFSKFYSVAPDGSLSKEIKEALKEIILSSPDLYRWHDHERFKLLRDSIEFLPKASKYIPLSLNF